MKCLILAAGYGSRLRGIAESKPLAPVGGTPLIEHAIVRASSAGASEFVVATGYQAERVEDFLANLRERTGFTITPIRCEGWDRPNGYTVLAGAAAIEGEYLLMMTDHLFDPAIVRQLLALDSRPDVGLTLAVDRALTGEWLDIDDATKVAVDDEERIVAIGKAIDRYNAIDTGLFRATPDLAKALQDDIAAGGGGSLSEGVQRLARDGRARAMPIGSARWIDVDSPAMLDFAETMLAQERAAAGALA
jgi:choline kinase